jgi:hypothetical protein
MTLFLESEKQNEALQGKLAAVPCNPGAACGDVFKSLGSLCTGCAEDRTREIS